MTWRLWSSKSPVDVVAEAEGVVVVVVVDVDVVVPQTKIWNNGTYSFTMINMHCQHVPFFQVVQVVHLLNRALRHCNVVLVLTKSAALMAAIRFS